MRTIVLWCVCNQVIGIQAKNAIELVFMEIIDHFHRMIVDSLHLNWLGGWQVKRMKHMVDWSDIRSSRIESHMVKRIQTTMTFKLRSAFRKHVRKPDGGIHQIFGGGVDWCRICLSTDIVFCRISTRSGWLFLFSFSVPSKNAISSMCAALNASTSNRTNWYARFHWPPQAQSK